MQTRIAKWGDSLAVRIPKAFASEAQLEEGMEVELSVEDGRIILGPVRPKYSLEELLEGITPENLHPETDWGPPVGKEVW